jgi:hypothetical protein
MIEKVDRWLLATAKPSLAISPRGGGRPRLPGPQAGYDPLAAAPKKIHFRKAKPKTQVAKIMDKGQQIWEPTSLFRPRILFWQFHTQCCFLGFLTAGRYSRSRMVTYDTFSVRDNHVVIIEDR